MLPENLQEICDHLTAKRAHKADIARAKAHAEIETIQRESDAYYDGVYDALRAFQAADKGTING